ncbi:putative Conditioned medium factor receptor 1 [Paratrimastix pyriformis]|uniref:Conditioned medium factor receptor 1 n=1 Tax=Paratrimastix pyriformis TaxID=342808 RepID=A0ABQ8UBP1_9EUKA|nr:putative Conditioned medium factor receptor 1 [Paratrimastix pyriformis]
MSHLDPFDVAVVGGGPGGSTTAYYLCKCSNLKVALFDQARFPRQKVCGEGVAYASQQILGEMGLLEKLQPNIHYCSAGGLSSPSGISYVETSTRGPAEVRIAMVHRTILDTAILRRAEQEGCRVFEGHHTTKVEYDTTSALWVLRFCVTPGEEGNALEDSSRERTYHARALVAADGASSNICRTLGLVTSPPQAWSSQSYIRAGTHRFQHDMFFFYRPSISPGYVSLFTMANGDVNMCVYAVPGTGLKAPDVVALHERLLREDPLIRGALGPEAQSSPIKAGPLRCGGNRRSYARALLAVGDAAGFVDPLTGEGIHWAMVSGQLAARTLAEGFAKGDLSARQMGRYQTGWRRAFGRGFFWSSVFAKAIRWCPILLDAVVARVRADSGASGAISPFAREWALCFAGTHSKVRLLHPRSNTSGIISWLVGQQKKQFFGAGQWQLARFWMSGDRC